MTYYQTYPYGFFNSSPPEQNSPYFDWRHFQMHFPRWKWYNSDTKLNEICSQESNWTSIGSDNGLAPNRRQAIILTNADAVPWGIYGMVVWGLGGGGCGGGGGGGWVNGPTSA